MRKPRRVFKYYYQLSVALNLNIGHHWSPGMPCESMRTLFPNVQITGHITLTDFGSKYL